MNNQPTYINNIMPDITGMGVINKAEAIAFFRTLLLAEREAIVAEIWPEGEPIIGLFNRHKEGGFSVLGDK